MPEPASPDGADPEALKSIGEGAGEPGSPGGEGDDFGAAQAGGGRRQPHHRRA